MSQIEFSEAKLKALEDKISHSRWVVPVLPEQELESLLTAAIELATKGNMLIMKIYLLLSKRTYINFDVAYTFFLI